MRNRYRKLLPKLRSEVRRLLATAPGCHDWDHTVRVWRMARHLARCAHADITIVEYAALLHDIGRQAEMTDRGRICHAAAAASLIPGILGHLGIHDKEFINRVVDCVRTHRYRRNGQIAPVSLEAKVLYDADKLDSIGAIGIARAFHFAGEIGARVHNRRSEAVASRAYSREDTGYREFLVKLRHVRGTMKTPEGKRLAAVRHRFMADFFRQLDYEVRGKT
ncbi:MAG: HD domain-containing protein [Kiritimatiellae bacterium]|nr:HD domain-containing protein [Kiritimatiellia bacterium]